MKIWHHFHASILNRRIRRQQRELARYVRRSAYEINAWKEDIAFLEEQVAHHRSFLKLAPQPNPDKVVSMEAGKSTEDKRPDSLITVFPDLSLSVAAEGSRRPG